MIIFAGLNCLMCLTGRVTTTFMKLWEKWELWSRFPLHKSTGRKTFILTLNFIKEIIEEYFRRDSIHFLRSSSGENTVHSSLLKAKKVDWKFDDIIVDSDVYEILNFLPDGCKVFWCASCIQLSDDEKFYCKFVHENVLKRYF